jgi:hypothetical protein
MISTLKPRCSAQRKYIRWSICAQSCESVPPAPEWMARTAPVNHRDQTEAPGTTSARRSRPGVPSRRSGHPAGSRRQAGPVPEYRRSGESLLSNGSHFPAGAPVGA